MKVQLILMDGSNQGHRLTLDLGLAVIGRARGNTVRLPSERISRRHCRLWLERNKVWVQDLGSQNGTFINDEVVVGKMELNSGDELKISHIRFKVQFAAETAARPEKPAKPAKARGSSKDEKKQDMGGNLDELALVPLDEPTPQDFDLPWEEDEEPQPRRASRPAETYDIPISDPADFRDILRELDEGSED